jgi:hypothetical protein
MLGGECLMLDAKRGTSDADGSMSFCRAKAWLLKLQQDNQWGLFGLVFHILGHLPTWNFPPPHKTRLGKAFIWPTHTMLCWTSHSQQTLAGSEMMSNVGLAQT